MRRLTPKSKQNSILEFIFEEKILFFQRQILLSFESRLQDKNHKSSKKTAINKSDVIKTNTKAVITQNNPLQRRTKIF